MGVCQSSEVQVQMQISKKIDRELRVTPEKLTQKLLLLGPGESGKSTILKQMQILHSNGFTDMEIEERRNIVYSNTITSMIAILEAMEPLGITFESSEREKDARIVRAVVEEGNELLPFTSETKKALKQLWADRGIRQCFDQRSVYQLNDSAKYFLDAVDRTGAKDYRPTEQDILFTRVATTGVVEVRFIIRNIQFRVFDVGGQRSERRKWIHCFDDVNAIIFIAAISEFDQTLREDAKSNRVMEALELFDNICNNAFFTRTSMILFLNKKDLFAEKIKTVSLNTWFPKYSGGQNYEEGIAFMKSMFARLNQEPGRRKIYMHETCATDTNQVQIVINSVIDTIIQENLKESGMM